MELDDIEESFVSDSVLMVIGYWYKGEAMGNWPRKKNPPNGAEQLSPLA